MNLPRCINVHNILTFLEYLYQNSISPKVIQNYLSSIRTMANECALDTSPLSHYSVAKYIRSISINSTFRPTPRGIFDLHTLYRISMACDILPDPLLFRAIFLVAFYGFLRMSNMAPHSKKQFSKDRHILRQDLIFAPRASTYSSNGPRLFRIAIPVIQSNSWKSQIHTYVLSDPSDCC